MKSAWLNIIFLLSVDPVMAQVLPDLRFSHLTDKDGLSNNEIKSIAQDEDGIIWIGTENGLNRFDGYGFKAFYANPADPLSIQNNRIQWLVAGTHGSLWGSTADGIFCFNSVTQHTRVFKSNPEDTGTLGNPFHAPYIYIDSTQLPWVSADEGLYHFYDSLHYKKIPTGIRSNAPPIARRSLLFGAVIRDRTGGLWSCWGNTIFRLGLHSKKVTQVFKGPDQVLIRDIKFDSQNRCWVSSWGKGIYLFDPATNDWQPFCPDNARAVCYGGAEWLLDGQPYMVFSCSSPCLFFVREKDLMSFPFPFDSSDVQFSSPPFVDRQNILWVPSNNGIFYSTPSNDLFRVITVPELKSDVKKPKFSFAYNMKEDSTGYWISKRDYGGIFWYDKDWKLIRSWYGAEVQPLNARFAASGSTAGEVFDFQRVGHEIFMTTEGGISILDLHTFKWTAVVPGDGATSTPRVAAAPDPPAAAASHPPAAAAPPHLARLRTIVIDNDHSWWIRSFDHGVYVFNPQTRKFIRHYGNEDTCKNCLPVAMNYLLKDKNNNLFATTSSGLYLYNRETDHFDKVRINGATLSRSLLGMAGDSSGLLWLGSENGLFAYNPVTHAIEKTFKEDNKIGIVYRVCTDDAQNIWFTSISGYWCWLRKPDKIIHFEYSLGLPKTDMGVFYKTSDGSVYAGGKDAVVKFFPDRVMNYRASAHTRIIEALVNDTIAAFVTKAGGRHQLTLTPDRNSVSVDFDVINYDLISTNQYFYKLTPGDKDWKRSEGGHLSFYNLQPGSYTLEVKGASLLTDGFTNTDSLDIMVMPYWYQSAWFKVGSILFLCLLATWFVRYRIGVVRKEGAFKQQMTEMEMTALRAQMNPHFIFNSLNSIENFMMQNERRLASDYLNKFATLVRMILENSRVPVVPLAQDMEAMQLYVDLEKLRFGDKFCYLTYVDDVLLEGDYKVAPLLIQPFVENAIVHGLAPSERPGLFLKISARLLDDFIHYTIEDNGIGRGESMAYARKYRPGHKSLGLRISQERIDLINKQNGTQGTVEIIDLFDKDHRPAGTRVELTTPSIYSTINLF